MTVTENKYRKRGTNMSKRSIALKAMAVSISAIMIAGSIRHGVSAAERKYEKKDITAYLFGMDEKTTLKTWTVMETLVGSTGFIIALIISIFV